MTIEQEKINQRLSWCWLLKSFGKTSLFFALLAVAHFKTRQFVDDSSFSHLRFTNHCGKGERNRHREEMTFVYVHLMTDAHEN